MYLVSFFQFISCTGVTSSPFFFVTFTIFLFISFWTLSVFHLKRRLEEYSVARFFDKDGRRYLVAGGLMKPEDIREVNIYRKQVLTGIITPGFLATTFLVGILILISAIFLFFVMPRPSEAGTPSFLAILGQEFGDERITGISDQMDLSGSGQIIEDDTLVMKVKPQTITGVPDTILLRAGALDDFDGKNWRNTGGDIMITKLLTNEEFPVGSNLAKYKIFVEMPEIGKLFSVFFPPIAVEGIAGRIIHDQGNQTYQYRAYDRYSYSVLSRKKLPEEEQLRSLRSYEAFFITRQRKYFRIREIPASVDDILVQIDIGKYENVYDKVKAIEKYLEANLTYTMNIMRTPGVDSPVEDFLFHTKSGHCELFATALAVLCRRAGIPSRIAYGYKVDEWNEYGQFYQVRQRDAHAWVEVFFPNVGEWVYFDPSPILAARDENPGFFKGIAQNLSRFIEAMKSKWYDSVVFYDLEKQKDFAMRIVEKAAVIAIQIKEWVGGIGTFAYIIWRWLSDSVVIGSIAIISIAAAITAAILLLRKKQVVHSRFKRSYQKGILRTHYREVRFYEKMLKILMGINIIKPENITPLEFAAQVESTEQAFGGIVDLTKYYYMVRFGDTKLQTSEINQIRNTLQRFRKAAFLKR